MLDACYEDKIEKYIENIFKEAEKYQEIGWLIEKNHSKIREIEDLNQIAKNELLMFLAMKMETVNRLESFLNSLCVIPGYESVRKRLKENLLNRCFWKTISEAEAVRHIQREGVSEELGFAKSSQKDYDIVYSIDGTKGFASVKSWDTIDIFFAKIRLEITKRSLLDRRYRNKHWNIKMDYIVEDHTVYPTNFKDEKQKVYRSVEKFLKSIEDDNSFDEYVYEDDFLKIYIVANSIERSLPIVANSFMAAWKQSDEDNFYHFGKMYASFIGLCWKEYSKLKNICGDRKVLANSRLILYTNLGLSGFLHQETIASGFDNILTSFNLNDFFKVEIIDSHIYQEELPAAKG